MQQEKTKSMVMQILLIDDDNEMREMIIKKLRSDGIKTPILDAADPIQALEIYNNNKNNISTIICDQYMPIENGLQLCEIIRSERPTIKIIIFTGDKDMINEQDVSSVDVILYKPEGINQLANFVNKF